MTIHIDYSLCNGCPDRTEGYCEEICPGDLFFRQDGKAVMREPADCWDCFACVKACPRLALFGDLPFQISEVRHRLTARIVPNHIVWTLLDRNGEIIATYTILNKTTSLKHSR